MNKTKNDQSVMLTFRCHRPLLEALNLVAKHNNLSRSSILRILLIQVLREKADTLISPPLKKSKKAVDTKGQS